MLVRATRRTRDFYLPHACTQLNETTISESKTNNNVWLPKVANTHVDERQDESCQGESAQAERSGVGEFTLCGWLVKTWLELTTESWESSRVSSVHVGK